MPNDPIDPRTGKPIERAKVIVADLGHPPCPSCGGKQSHPIDEGRRCANCGNIWKPEIAEKKK